MKPKGRELLRKLANSLPSSESESSRDGVFSTRTEIHSFILSLGVGVSAFYVEMPMLIVGVIGLALGMQGFKSKVPVANPKAIEELKKEPWYAVGGVLLGYYAPQLLSRMAV